MMTEKKDEIFSAIAVAVLLIGTAAGNAIVLLVLSAFALAIGLVFFRPRIGNAPLRIMTVAAVTGIIIAGAISFLTR